MAAFAVAARPASQSAQRASGPITIVLADDQNLVRRGILSEPLSRRPIANWLQRAKSTAVDAYETLTGREHEILALVAEGHSNAGIANRLCISRRTAESHRASVMHKLNFRNRYVLARAIPVLST